MTILTQITRACWLHFVRACALLLLASAANAELYMAAIGKAEWQLQRSAIACRLTQSVPRYGDAIFETLAGGRQSFVLRSKNNPMLAGPSTLIAAAPSWNPTREPITLGTFEIAESNEPLHLGDEPTSRLLDSLRAGLVPGFKRPLQADTSKQASVNLSPIDFMPAYRQYRSCIDQLLPVAFAQIQNTVIEFGSEQTDLNPQAQKKIDLMLRYIKEDHALTHFEINAISSDKARVLENLNLSKQRAQQVSEYLMSRGIDAKVINTSYRGARADTGAKRSVSISVRRGTDN